MTRDATPPHPTLDGRTATFVWRGRSQPTVVGDFCGWEMARARPLTRTGPTTWSWSIPLQSRAYVEYVYYVDGERRLDPLNASRRRANGFGQLNNYFTTPGYVAPALTTRVRGVPRGTTTSHRLPPLWDDHRRPRVVRLYRPPVAGRVPLVVAYDGPDYRVRARLTTMLDRLIAAHRVRPVAVAFLPTTPTTRFVEYACSDVTLAYVLDQVLPLARAELDLVDVRRHPGAFGALGASMGGTMALYTALRRPEVFGHAIAQSSSLAVGDHDYVAWDLARRSSPLPARVWLSAGHYDMAGIRAANRRLRTLLERRGVAVAHREPPTGHNFTSWSDDLWRALEWMYAP